MAKSGRGIGWRGGRGGRGRNVIKSNVKKKSRGSTARSSTSAAQPQPPPRTSKRPPTFSGFQGPSDHFVEVLHPQFEEIVNMCYAGFRVEAPETFEHRVHEEARQAFNGLEAGGLFRPDVTQPFGLGTKCAVTYVTRTLVGEPGTTYKYLGIRMFSHPWTTVKSEEAESEYGVPAALRRVRFLNDRLKDRSRRLLEATQDAGGRGEGVGEFGSCEFNIALINRMEPSEDRPDLKLEPTFGKDRCSVSWHADSCLEHYSTIAVYHVTDPEVQTSTNGGHGNPDTAATDWRIALRVEPDAEGPAAGKLKQAATANQASNADRAPAVAVALPSRSAYFLLDDFNHHHQHAVLAGQSHRWSSTHRVAKTQGHSFDYISGRCQTVLGDSHRRTLKQWKTEQLTLSELEFEWIRQFYIQGRAHYALHSWWHEPLQQLLRFWSLLEGRTEVVVNTLQGAAESRFDQPPPQPPQQPDSGGGVTGADGTGTGTTTDDRREKKARQRRSKQRQVVESLGGRAVFSTIADALRDRANKRRQWAERELDKVFDRLPADARPMPCPLSPSCSPSAGTTPVSSPLPRSPETLGALADAVLEWGKIYSGEDGVRGGGICSAVAAMKAAVVAASVAAADDGAVGKSGSSSTCSIPISIAEGPATGSAENHLCPHPSRPPWETGRFALEMQAPWARRLLDGEKTVETRAYPLPTGLVGRSIELLESRPGRDGVSSVGDVVDAFSEGVAIVGRVVFRGTEPYPSREAWAADAARHLVPVVDEADSGAEGDGGGKGYGWKGPDSVHAWTVASVAAYPKPRAVRRMGRVFRSLFLVEQPDRKQPRGDGGSGGVSRREDSSGAGVGDGGEGSGVDESKRKRKPKKKRKRKGRPGGGDDDRADGAGVEKAALMSPCEQTTAAKVGGVAVGSPTVNAAAAVAPATGKDVKKRKRKQLGQLGDGKELGEVEVVAALAAAAAEARGASDGFGEMISGDGLARAGKRAPGGAPAVISGGGEVFTRNRDRKKKRY